MPLSLVPEFLLVVVVGIDLVVAIPFGWFSHDSRDSLTDTMINERLRQFLGAVEGHGFGS